MKAEEVHALTTFNQAHDPGLGLLGLQAQLGQDDCERLAGVLSLQASRRPLGVAANAGSSRAS